MDHWPYYLVGTCHGVRETPDNPEAGFEDYGNLDLFQGHRGCRWKGFHYYVESHTPNPNEVQDTGMILRPVHWKPYTDLCKINALDCQYVLTETCLQVKDLIDPWATKVRHCQSTIGLEVLGLVEKYDFGRPWGTAEPG